ncbi:MAG: 2OG-Fe(II) oxygenase [Alphaproteobacteria bacterium]|nr:2OG-Fe(II) oxygenase [Alphaproteobacteria bacterium]MBL6939705.1 2OG-Fe(II) oxygenase [Alphaproteobacteria bacterium]MBL7096973.1 2OG-Fe(II) oxygenase [Alphaproteobacteria bacterium]
MSPRLNEHADGIYTLTHFLSADECARLIAHAEASGFEAASIVTGSGTKFVPSIRNNARVIQDDLIRAADLWARLRDHVPPFIAGRQAIGVNERFRFYRYDPGQQFAGHEDAPFRRDNGEQSLLTFMVYLNDGFEGGETVFREVVIAPAMGTALLFRHELFHEGRAVRAGRKYVLRSDVMFNPPGRISG